MDRHAAYVGLTRHRDGVALHYAAEDFADPAQLARSLSRERAKDTTLDYGGRDPVRQYAERRGLDPLRPDSAIVVRAPAPEREAETVAPSRPVPDPGLAQAVAAGRAGFRARFEAHQRQQAQAARDEAAARALVDTWGRLRERYAAALPGIEADPGLGGTRDALVRFARGLREQPGAVRVLREQGEAFGMAERPNLARVLADPDPERVVQGMMASAEDGMRVQLKAAAEREAALQREQQLRAAQRPSRGMSMGM